MLQPKVNFLIVKENSAKWQGIVQIANHCFHHRIKLLFSVASEEVGRYVDELLWKFPVESFLPHAVVNRPSTELIVISADLKNYNQAEILFNLRPEPNLLAAQFPLIYDFFDETVPSKKELSEKRKLFYQEQNFLLN